MPLESATYISDLVVTNPVHATDDVSAGDDHIRLIKSTLKNTFTALTGAVTVSQTVLNGVQDASNLSSGTLPDARLSSNVPLKDAGTNAFTNNVTIGGTLGVTGNVTLATADLSVGGNLTLTGTLNGVATSDFARLSQANTFTASGNRFSASNPQTWFINTGAGTDQGKWLLDFSGGNFDLYAINDAEDSSETPLSFTRTGTDVTSLTLAANSITFNGTVTTSNVSASEVGYKGAPPSGKTADHTIVAADAGHVLRLTSAADDITIQASGAPPDGSVVGILNKTGGSIDILQGSGMTLTLAGTALTGNRTLVNNGMAFVYFDTSGNATVGGSGVA